MFRRVIGLMFGVPAIALAVLMGLFALFAFANDKSTTGNIVAISVALISFILFFLGVRLCRRPRKPHFVTQHNGQGSDESFSFFSPADDLDGEAVDRAPKAKARPRFLGNGGGKLLIEAYWCETPVKLSRKLKTPLGSSISVINVCLDIQYNVDQGQIVLQRVQLSRGGGRIGGSNSAINVASDRTGEAWFESNIGNDSELAEVVTKDLSASDSRLRKIMIGKWRDANRDVLVGSLTDALNAHAAPDEIAQLISNAGRGNDIVFTYTKPDGQSETRPAHIKGIVL